MTETGAQWQAYLDRIARAGSLQELDAIDLELFGRKQGKCTLLLKELGELVPDARKARGEALNMWKVRLLQALDLQRQRLQATAAGSLAESDVLDATLHLPPRQRGHLHPIPEFIRQVEKVFGRLGFDVAHGNEIESEDYNFTMLNFEKDHAALDMQATFWIEGDERRVLRTHTSPVQVRYMQSHKPPFRMICPGKVYRKDADATHSPMFHQFEGLMVGKGISIANMKAVMSETIRELIAPHIQLRFRTSYFPFVEPGLEMDILWKDRKKEDAGRWLEVVGCGMVHPTVLKNGGIDPKKWQGFAFGFGIERLLMIKHAIPDLRLFYEGDLRFLKQFS